MRPLRLEVKGFTAFRDPVELDFTELDVFAISGPTGSGKSSLLDAMTYALYGRVERVGDRVSQLISQGQPRMVVTLEFEVGHDRYRVTRSTPAKGATKILLERRDPGGEWEQAGEGADRVREAEPIIARAIGLTYDGFTRSVLLPQGKFAEFLVGEARKRRDILTELLGLSLFRRMAERAGSIGKESSIRAEAMNDMLEREFAGATPEALEEARGAAQDAARRERQLTNAAEGIVEILGRWRDSRRSAEELRACADEAAAIAGQAEDAARELGELTERLGEAVAQVEERVAMSKAAQQVLDQAQAALREAEATSGPAKELAAGQVWAHSLDKATRGRARKTVEQARVVEASEALAGSLERATADLASRRKAMSAGEGGVRKAEAAREAALHADLVTAVSAGLKVGDPCPVCGRPLERAPKRRSAGALAKAEAGLTGAKRRLDAAGKAVADAERSCDAARREVEANAAEQARLVEEVAELSDAIQAEEARLRSLLGEPLPGDPAAEIDRRLEERQRLDHAERDADRRVGASAQAVVKAERERDRIGASIDRQRDRLAADHRPLFDRAARAIGTKASPVELTPPPETGDPAALKGHAERVAEALAAFATRMAGEVDRYVSVEGTLLQEAAQTVRGLVEPPPTLEALAEAVNAACRSATAHVATTSQRATDLADKLERKRDIAKEVKSLDGRATVFKALALELRADRLVAFLQADALQVLASAGSHRLASISDGRYRLVCRDEEFLVVDTWNGDEERSVRTLSGGETFLASLALALALAEQVRSLSVTDRARLDSLFLDEGFGTLDAETLRTVVEAIEQLATDGRLVGVITHVRELAEQFPRIEIEKSARGSRLRPVP
jgi:DNA repair protein SbcC/Rad50